jgi:glycosyltransferase involved in cell wall biosynthesis
MTETIETNTRSLPRLSIVIPTRNRKVHIDLLLQNLYELFIGYHDEIEIIVSDNSDNPLIFSALPVNVQIIRPESFLPTAEENLFFALSKCTGEFIWPLGDDDVPQREGVAALLNFLDNPVGDWAVFNYGVIDFTGVLKSLKLLKSLKPEVKFLYSDFVSIAGYQTTAACISLTVFKNTLVTKARIEEVLRFTSPIYSHVALYLLSFGNLPGLFIDTPLVHYRNNRQATSSRDDNWVRWSRNNQIPYRHPWTVGLIEQLNYLAVSGIIKADFPVVFLETDHFGNKFSGLQQLISYVIDQLRIDEKLGTKYKFSSNDKAIIARFLQKHAPQHTYLIEALQSGVSANSKTSGAEFAKYSYLSRAYTAVVSRFVFAHAVVKLADAGITYRVPMGYMYLPHGDLNYIKMIEYVDFFQSNLVNFSTDLNLLDEKIKLTKDFSKIKPKVSHSYSNFESHMKPNKSNRMLSLARKIKEKLF